MDIFKIAFTGGPCALKTKTITKVEEELTKDGYYVVVVPETAAELIRNGIKPNSNKKHTERFQELVLETQTNKEKIAEEYCELIKNSKLEFIKNKKGIVILYDRSVMDNRAYLSHEDYNNLLKKYNVNEIGLIDKFDLVLDLISTATLRPEFYALDGIRYETVEEAAYKDLLTSSAWLLHRNLKIVKPMDKEEDKVNIVLNHIYDLLNKNYKNEIKVFEVDKEKSDLTCYNDNNSRRIKIKTINLQSFDNVHFTLFKREYNGKISLIKKVISLKEWDDEELTVETKPISLDDYNELIYTNMIKNIKEKDVMYCIDNGSYFNLSEDKNGMKLYTELEESEIPKNIVLKKSLKK